MMQLSHPPLQDRIAVVTGASSGIGAATARALAREGATVVIGYHQGRDRAQALREELPGSHHTLQLSLQDEASHATAAQWLQQHRSEEHTSELQSHLNLVCRLLLEKKKNLHNNHTLKHKD